MFSFIKGLFERSDQPSTPSTARTKEWCVLALLYAAVRSDALITAEEEVTLDSLASRTPTLVRLSPDLLTTYLSEYREMLRGRNSVSLLVDAACESLPEKPGLGEAIFAQCVDIVMADRHVASIEDEFLSEIAEKLRLPRAKIRDIMQVMRWKNELKEAG